MTPTLALAVKAPGTSFERVTIDRRELQPHDVLIEIAHCGICHSDLHQAEADWGGAIFPMVPGHEIAGIVSAIGGEVSAFAVGDRVGVGVWVDSCGICEYCIDGEEPFCSKGAVLTYNARDYDGQVTYGGYSQRIVVRDHFVVRIPPVLALDVAAPLLCAGVTMYTPLKHYQVRGKRVAIVGFGGLGHVGVKLAHAMGAEVTLLSRTFDKHGDARRSGADLCYATSEAETFRALASRFDVILNTVPTNLDLDAYLGLLRPGGAFVSLGLPSKPDTFKVFSVVPRRRIITGSNTGNIRNTQEMLDLCAAHSISADIEPIDASDVANAYERLRKADVRYRFVIDVSTLKA